MNWTKVGESLEWNGTLRGAGSVQVWILPRPDYCDRGHWCWGYTGSGANYGVEGSYYFMSLEAAVSEIELMLVRGCQYENEEKQDPSLKAKDVLSKLWVNHQGTYHRIHATEEASAMLTLKQNHDDTGLIWVLDCSGIDHLDEGDGFPRLYRSLKTATEEADRFIDWRLNKKRFEHPTDVLRTFEKETPSWAQGQSLELYLGDQTCDDVPTFRMF